MIQYLVVAFIVLLAAAYIGGRYLPAPWRRLAVYKLSDGRGDGWLARWLDKDASCGSGCDTCGSCETEALPEKDAQGRKVIQVHLKR
jgi:hypothetical protein